MGDDTNYKDLADGLFIESWPDWVRWTLFIPASLLIPFLYLLLQSLIQTWYYDMGEDSFFFALIRGIVYGGGIVIVGSIVAPRGQKAIALIYLVLIAMLVGVLFFGGFLYGTNFTAILELIFILGAAGYATYFVFNELG